MRRTSVKDVNCSIAQCVEVIGDWWTILIVRDVFLGIRRFDDIQQRLGISRNVLSQRLDLLVEHGILTRRQYQERPPRYDYVLTERGRDLWPVLQAMREWGDRWEAPHGPRIETLHTTCGHTTTLVPTCEHCGEQLEIADLRAVEGPGAGADSPLRRGQHHVEKGAAGG